MNSSEKNGLILTKISSAMGENESNWYDLLVSNTTDVNKKLVLIAAEGQNFDFRSRIATYAAFAM